MLFLNSSIKKKPPDDWSGGNQVRKKGLEPPRREAPDPKSGAATNYATSAVRIILRRQRYDNYGETTKKL